MKIKSYLTIFLIFILSITSLSANCLSIKKDTVKKDFPGHVFGCVYTGYYYNFNDHEKPVSAFNLPQGLLGYRHKLDEKVSAIII